MRREYTTGFKERMIQRMAGPEGISACALAREVGVGQPTLSRWLREARSTLDSMGKKKKKATKRQWTAQEKLRTVIEAAGLTEEEIGAFLRREGLHRAQLEEWTEAVTSAGTEALKTRKRRTTSAEGERIKELERDLRKKEKALAEVTALLALKKKLAELWGDEDDDTTTRNET